MEFVIPLLKRASPKGYPTGSQALRGGEAEWGAVDSVGTRTSYRLCWKLGHAGRPHWPEGGGGRGCVWGVGENHVTVMLESWTAVCGQNYSWKSRSPELGLRAWDCWSKKPEGGRALPFGALGSPGYPPPTPHSPPPTAGTPSPKSLESLFPDSAGWVSLQVGMGSRDWHFFLWLGHLLLQPSGRSELCPGNRDRSNACKTLHRGGISWSFLNPWAVS